MRLLLTLCLLLLLPTHAAQVCQVWDGDTFRVLDQYGGCTQRVRLANIDAPELGQPMGKASRDYLAAMVLGKDTPMACKGWSYKRRVCSALEVEAAMVRAGLAYDYTKYSKGALKAVETEAASRRVGIWSDPASIPPWRWRRQHH